MIRSRSTSATVRPTSEPVPPSAGASPSPSSSMIASVPMASPLASSTARWMVFSSSRTLPGQAWRSSASRAAGASGRSGTPLASAYFLTK